MSRCKFFLNGKWILCDIFISFENKMLVYLKWLGNWPPPPQTGLKPKFKINLQWRITFWKFWYRFRLTSKPLLTDLHLTFWIYALPAFPPENCPYVGNFRADGHESDCARSRRHLNFYSSDTLCTFQSPHLYPVIATSAKCWKMQSERKNSLVRHIFWWIDQGRKWEGV